MVQWIKHSNNSLLSIADRTRRNLCAYFSRNDYRVIFGVLALSSLVLILFSLSESALAQVPSLSINLGESDGPDDVVPTLKIVGMLTVLALAPSILLMMTSFTRIMIVLGFVRQAIGTQTLPPNQVIIGLSMFLTFFTMGPIIDTAYEQAYQPYVEKKIDFNEALERVKKPMRSFMLAETRQEDLAIFFNIAGISKPAGPEDVPFRVLIPSFMISELKTAFQIGFMIYLPFLIIDMVVSSILMAMGMMMLPPTVVSLPFKLVLFVLVDGWQLIVSSVVKSFQVMN